MSNITVVLEGNELKLFIVGRFDYSVIDEFRESYMGVVDKSMDISLDFSQTEHIDSSALGMVLNMKNHLEKEDQTIIIKNCKPNLMKLFSLAHFERKFKFV